MRTKFGYSKTEDEYFKGSKLRRMQDNQIIENRNWAVAHAFIHKAINAGWSPTWERFPVTAVSVFTHYNKIDNNHTQQSIRFTIICNVEVKVSIWDLIFQADRRFVKSVWGSKWKTMQRRVACSSDPMNIIGNQLEREGLINKEFTNHSNLWNAVNENRKV